MHCLPQRLKSTFFEIFRVEGALGCSNSALFASKAKINVFEIFPHSGSPAGTLHSKKFQKTLILAFEANSALYYQINFFPRDLAHCGTREVFLVFLEQFAQNEGERKTLLLSC